MATVSLQVRRLVMIVAVTLVLLAMTAAPALAKNNNQVKTHVNAHVKIGDINIGDINISNTTIGDITLNLGL